MNISSECEICGATDSEIDQANKEGNAKFYIICGCDFHGDHLGCTRRCKSLGCTHKIGKTYTCDHTYEDLQLKTDLNDPREQLRAAKQDAKIYKAQAKAATKQAGEMLARAEAAEAKLATLEPLLTQLRESLS